MALICFSFFLFLVQQNVWTTRKIFTVKRRISKWQSVRCRRVYIVAAFQREQGCTKGVLHFQLFSFVSSILPLMPRCNRTRDKLESNKNLETETTSEGPLYRNQLMTVRGAFRARETSRASYKNSLFCSVTAVDVNLICCALRSEHVERFYVQMLTCTI